MQRLLRPLHSSHPAPAAPLLSSSSPSSPSLSLSAATQAATSAAATIPPQAAAASTASASASAAAAAQSTSSASIQPSLAAIKRDAIPTILQSVFLRFVQAAEAKVAGLLYLNLDRDEDLSMHFKAGADMAFDRLMSSVGSIAKHCPKLIIDSIMVWRKSKTDNTAAAISDHIRAQYPMLRPRDLDAIIKERLMLLSNFVLCRVLIAIISQLAKNTLPNDLGNKLEEMIFGQFKNADPDVVSKSVNRQANVDMFAELIGALSNIRFGTVSDRFISEIGRGAAATMKENKMELLIRSMRFLKLKIYPMDSLEETTDFLHTSAELFQNAQSVLIRHAFADVFVQLLDPIASVATAEVNLPAWQKAVETIHPKAVKMALKSQRLSAVLPLISTLLCVSRKDFFLKAWGDFVSLLVQRFRDKNEKEKDLRPIALASLTRLIWVYLFRCFESPASTVQRRIDVILRTLFPPHKKGVVPFDGDIHNFVSIVYFILVKYPDYGNEAVLNSLLGPESLNLPASAILLTNYAIGNIEGESGYNPGRMVELIPNPERLLVALRSFLLFLVDVEITLGDSQGSSSTTAGTVSAVQSGTGMVVVEGKINLPSPRFPEHHIHSMRAVRSIDPISKLSTLQQHPQHHQMHSSMPSDPSVKSAATMLSGTTASQPTINSHISEDLLNRMGSTIRDTLSTIDGIVGRALICLDQAMGGVLVIDGSISPSVNSGSGTVSATTMTGTATAAATSAAVAASGGTISSSISGSNARRVSNAPDTMSGFPSPVGATDKEKVIAMEIFGKERVHLDLLRAILESIPRYTPRSVPALRVLEILSRLMLHVDEGVRSAAFGALSRIALIDEQSSQHEYWQAAALNQTMAATVQVYATPCDI
eukprot:jgi/Hompol1/6195/HPOL_000607-RA